MSGQIMAGLGATAPTMHFPRFNGENPNLWKTLTEQYFQMFSTHESYGFPWPLSISLERLVSGYNQLLRN
jgi:hypothetical protein